jgi:hypothetical protein
MQRAGLSYRELAKAQGVVRPFDILVRLHPLTRRRLAAMLGCRLGMRVHPPAEAWCLINQNLRGMQARTHTLPEQLSPFAQNSNWWEIVTRTARRLRVRFYPGLDETAVERLVFERFASSFVAASAARQAEDVDHIAAAHPLLPQLMSSLRLSRDAARSVLSALALTTVRADGGVRDGCQRIAEWLCRHLPWSWTHPISHGLQLLQPKLTDIFASWIEWGRRVDPGARLGAAVAVIYFQDLVDRTLDEYAGC